MDKYSSIAIRQMEHALRGFLNRKDADGYADFLQLSHDTEAHLIEQIKATASSDRMQFIVLNHFESVCREVLLQKVRLISRKYLASGTSFAMASGRVWATSHRWVEYLQILLSDLKELRSLFPDLMTDAIFVAALFAVRKEFKVEAAYHPVKDAILAFGGIKDRLLKKALRVESHASLGEVTVALEQSMPVCLLVRELNHEILGAGPGIESQLCRQLSAVNPTLSDAFNHMAKQPEAKDGTIIERGAVITLKETDFAFELQRLELELCRKVMDLILDAQMLSEDPSIKLLPAAEKQVLSVKSDLEKLDEKFGEAFERPLETSQDRTRLQRLGHQVVLSHISKQSPNTATAFDYLRSLVPLINSANAKRT